MERPKKSALDFSRTAKRRKIQGKEMIIMLLIFLIAVGGVIFGFSYVKAQLNKPSSYIPPTSVSGEAVPGNNGAGSQGK